MRVRRRGRWIGRGEERGIGIRRWRWIRKEKTGIIKKKKREKEAKEKNEKVIEIEGEKGTWKGIRRRRRRRMMTEEEKGA